MDTPATHAQLGWMKIAEKRMSDVVFIMEANSTTSQNVKDRIDDIISALTYLRRLL